MLFKYLGYIKKFIILINNKLRWILFNQNSSLKNKHLDWLYSENLNNKKNYVCESNENVYNENSNPKIISFYLPQYYENEVNNKNFGKGFMEWYNVTKMIPQFTGHYQPQLPIDVGFYDLTHDDVMYRQIELAKKYGISAFCFYYYWFSGEKLLEKPLYNFLNNKELDIPFCLMWCNEDWTNEWNDGQNKKIIMKQDLMKNDDNLFIEDIIKFFNDNRYIKVNNMPVLIIYKPQKFPYTVFKEFLNSINQKVKSYGFDGIYFLTTNACYEDVDIYNLGFESYIEFSPGLLPISSQLYDLKGKYVNPLFNGKIIDIREGLKKNLHITENNKKKHKCVFPGWDNSARKAYCKAGATVLQMEPEDFKKWLKDSCTWTKKNLPENEQFVFINAWNEWAEGAHLEPDQKYGYAYLDAVKQVVKDLK